MFKIIVAHDLNRVIGNGPNIPWYIKEDFLHFKETTLNHIIIMGSTTFNSIGKVLPNRTTIIVNFTSDFESKGCEVVTDINVLIKRYYQSEEVVYICGGASIYKAFLPYTQELIISEIQNTYEGDVYFPEYKNNFVLISQEEKQEFIIKRYLRQVNG
ncbi:MAG: dihydrofolate reductase [Bacillales bacterium]|nr:dihydrofolate reductase [Bacillales bacterium]